MGTRVFFLWVALLSCGSAAELDDQRAYLGLAIIAASEAQPTFEANQVPKRLIPKAGMLVLDVMPIARQQGAMPFDLILTLDRRPVNTPEQWSEVMATKAPGDKVDVQFKRFIGVWKTLKGQLSVTTERKACYQALDVTGSEVVDSFRGEHTALTGNISTISPVIVVRERKPSLWLKVRWYDSDWLFLQSMGLKAKGVTAKAEFPLATRDQDVLVEEQMVMETVTVEMPKQIAELLRTPVGTPIIGRFDGKSKYVEHELPQLWHSRARTVVQVFDDMVATGDVSMFVQHAH